MKHLTILVPDGQNNLSSIVGTYKIFTRANEYWRKSDNNRIGNRDLFKIELPDKNRTLEVNVIFGDGKLILNDSIPTRVDISAALGSVHTPDRTTNGLGNSVYTTSSYRENIPFIRIKASAVFGKLIIENKRW